MRSLLAMLLILFFAVPAAAQKFWLLTESYPPGIKTCLTGMEDTILFTGTKQGVWKTFNAGRSWRNVLPNKQTIYSLYVSPSRQVLAGGTGKIYFSNDKGQTWDSVQLNYPHPVVQITTDQTGGFVAITKFRDKDTAPVDGDVWYCAGDLSVWETRNNGLPPNPPCDFIVSDKRGRLYLMITDDDVTGAGGLFISDTKGQSWRQINFYLGDAVDPWSYKVLPQYATGLSITPSDSILVSFSGLTDSNNANLVVVNVAKSLKEIEKATTWIIKDGDKVWEAMLRSPVHVARNGDWYSSATGQGIRTGTIVSKDNGQTWEFHREGLGMPESLWNERHDFYETSHGKIFMIQYDDERLYWTETSIVDSKKISGRIVDEEGRPRLLKVSAGQEYFSYSDNDGYYTIAVPEGWKGTVSAEQRALVFSPSTISVTPVRSDTVLQDIVAILAKDMFVISGKVVDKENKPVAGVAINGLPEIIETNEQGLFALAVVADWSGTIAPAFDHRAFSPGSVQIDPLTADKTDILFQQDNSPAVFTVQGQIIKDNEGPMSNVTLQGLPGNVVTDEKGFYSTALPIHWSGHITPMKDGYTFGPSQFSIHDLKTDLENINAVGYPEETVTHYTISGTIKNTSGKGMVDIVIGGLPVPVRTDIHGNFSWELPEQWSGTITPTAADYKFTPASIHIASMDESLAGQNFRGATITSIEDEHGSLVVAPNPSTGTFEITMAEAAPFTLQIFSTGGQLLSAETAKSNNGKHTFSIAPKGVFIVKLFQGSKMQVCRVITY